DLEGSAGQVGVKKTELAALVAAEGRFPMKAVAETLEVARSHLHDKVRHSTKLRGPYRKPDDALMPLVRRLVDERPTYGYRRITPLANRERARAGAGSTPGRRATDLCRPSTTNASSASCARTACCWPDIRADSS